MYRRVLNVLTMAFLAIVTIGMSAQAAEMDWEATVKTESMVLEATRDILSVPLGHAQTAVNFTSTDGHDGMTGGIQLDHVAGGDMVVASSHATNHEVTLAQTSTAFRDNYWTSNTLRESLSSSAVNLMQDRPLAAAENRHTDGGRSATNADIAGVFAATFIREPMVVEIGS